MNIVDKDFFKLIKFIKSLNEEELYINIKKNFLNIPKETQYSIEKFFNTFNFWGKIDIKNNNYEALYLKAKVLKKHYKDFVQLYKKLKDYKSKKLLYSILNNWLEYDFETISTCLGSPFKHYYDLDIIPHCQNEIVVDLGAYNGDSVIDYIYTYGKHSYKKIFCYDITPDTFISLKKNLLPYKNIHFKQKAISNKKEKLYLNLNEESSSANKASKDGTIKLNTTTLDKDIKEKITLLKMDIEGSEEKAIIGAKKHIIKDKPKLLISVYHNNNHLWKIPKLITEFNKNYQLYLRCYGNCIYPTEIVLFAIPPK